MTQANTIPGPLNPSSIAIGSRLIRCPKCGARLNRETAGIRARPGFEAVRVSCRELDCPYSAIATWPIGKIARAQLQDVIDSEPHGGDEAPADVCQIRDCGRSVTSGRWCKMHYSRWTAIGQPKGYQLEAWLKADGPRARDWKQKIKRSAEIQAAREARASRTRRTRPPEGPAPAFGSAPDPEVDPADLDAPANQPAAACEIQEGDTLATRPDGILVPVLRPAQLQAELSHLLLSESSLLTDRQKVALDQVLDLVPSGDLGPPEELIPAGPFVEPEEAPTL